MLTFRFLDDLISERNKSLFALLFNVQILKRSSNVFAFLFYVGKFLKLSHRFYATRAADP